MAAPPRVLLTGASGFVGRAVARRLAETGAAVRPALRKGPAAPGAVVVGEIGPHTDWSAALAGVDAVVHLAARAHVVRETEADPDAAFRRVNVDGTRRLAEAARAAGVRRFVYLSSAGVHGDRTDGKPFTEDAPPRPHDAYTRSKWEAEQALAATAGLPVAVLRAPLVYGPGAPANFLELLRAVDAERLLPLGAVRNRRDLVGVENLADAVAACLSKPEAAGRRYLVADGDPVSTPELVRRLAAALGRRARLPAVPVFLLRAAAFATGRLRRLDKVIASFEVDASRLRRELGWSPRVPMRDGLRAAADAWRAAPWG
jgi:nucleoside-diphosphate-sugar epimerase